MSYCRFSDDDFQCDVYVYDDVAGGTTIHVARSRVLFKEPLPEKLSFPVGAAPDGQAMTAWFERHRKVQKMVESADFEMIALEHAGESFYGMDHEDAANFLEKLAALGYRVPDYAISALREEGDGDE